jgi:hypothetical protein
VREPRATNASGGIKCPLSAQIGSRTAQPAARGAAVGAGADGAPYPYRSPVISRSFVRLCRAATRRTVPDRARITIDSVVAVEPS